MEKKTILYQSTTKKNSPFKRKYQKKLLYPSMLMIDTSDLIGTKEQIRIARREDWMEAVYELNEPEFKKRFVSKNQFKEEMEEWWEKADRAFKTREIKTPKKASEILEMFERSETFRSAKERGYENISDLLKRKAPQMNREIKKRLGRDLTVEDVEFDDYEEDEEAVITGKKQKRSGRWKIKGVGYFIEYEIFHDDDGKSVVVATIIDEVTGDIISQEII